MKIASKTDVGLKREENQDREWVGRLDNDAVLAVICDGMGGANAGSTASEIAISEFTYRVKAGFTKTDRPNFLKNLMITSIEAANTVVYQKSTTDETLQGMGTTCVAAIISEKAAYIINVGDSRAYLIRGGEIYRITEDHTVVSQWVAEGKITEDEANEHPQRNIITRAVGVSPKVTADYYELDVEQDDILLLCSDGLSSYCNMVESLDIINSAENLQDAANSLVEYAIAQGGTDNITVTLISNEAGDI